MHQPIRIKALIFVVSLVISVLLWLQVPQNTPMTEKHPFSASIEYENVPPGLAIISDDRAVQVGGELTADEIGKLTNDISAGNVKLHARVDLSDATAGKHAYHVKFERPPGYRVQWADDKLHAAVVLEPVSTKELPISIEYRGRFTPNTLVFVNAEPDVVKASISGPQSQVDQVVKIRGILDLAKVTEPGLKIPVALEALKANGNSPAGVEVDPDVVTVRPAVSAAPSQRSALVVPIFKGQTAFGYQVTNYTITPVQVVLKGSSGVLARVATVETQAIDLTGIKVSTNYRSRVIIPAKGGGDTTGITAYPGRVTVRVEVGPAVTSPAPAPGQALHQ